MLTFRRGVSVWAIVVPEIHMTSLQRKTPAVRFTRRMTIKGQHATTPLHSAAVDPWIDRGFSLKELI